LTTVLELNLPDMVIMRKSYTVFCLFTALTVPLLAQRDSSFRASIRGGGDRNGGKCTVEVEVDDAAEVEIRGDTGRLRTLAGQPARWRRFECTGVMPDRPGDFRFQGIDGRGRVQLIRDPRENRGAAVVRIEDPNGGREGYTFDLIWQGGFSGRDSRDNRDYRDDRYRRDSDFSDDRDRSRGRGDSFILTCSSDDMRRHYCDAETRGGVRLLQQRSQAECRRDYSWGVDRRGIWVDRGCRADFEVAR
jgi:hypothetical protein